MATYRISLNHLNNMCSERQRCPDPGLFWLNIDDVMYVYEIIHLLPFLSGLLTTVIREDEETRSNKRIV